MSKLGSLYIKLGQLAGAPSALNAEAEARVCSQRRLTFELRGRPLLACPS